MVIAVIVHKLKSTASAKVVSDLCVEFAGAVFVSSITLYSRPIQLLLSLFTGIFLTVIAVHIVSQLESST